MDVIFSGDVVIYKGQRYYCQPSGNSCFLYFNKDDVGYPSKSHATPSITQVRKVVGGPLPKHPLCKNFMDAPLAIVKLELVLTLQSSSGKSVKDFIDGFIYPDTTINDLVSRVGSFHNQAALAWVRLDGSLTPIMENKELLVLKHGFVVRVYPTAERRSEALQAEEDHVYEQKLRIECTVGLILDVARPPTSLTPEDAYRLPVAANTKPDPTPIELSVFWDGNQALLSLTKDLNKSISWRAVYAKIKELSGTQDIAIVLANKNGTLHWIPPSLRDVRCLAIACKATIAVWTNLGQKKPDLFARLGIWVPFQSEAQPEYQNSNQIEAQNSNQIEAQIKNQSEAQPKKTFVLIGDSYVSHYDLLKALTGNVQDDSPGWIISKGTYDIISPKRSLFGENLEKAMESVLRTVPCATVVYCLSHNKRITTDISDAILRLRHICLWKLFPKVAFASYNNNTFEDQRWNEDAQQFVRKYVAQAEILRLNSHYPASIGSFLQQVNQFPSITYCNLPKIVTHQLSKPSFEEVAVYTGEDRADATMQCAQICASYLDTKYRITALQCQSQSALDHVRAEYNKIEHYTTQLQKYEWIVLCNTNARAILPNLVQRYLGYRYE